MRPSEYWLWFVGSHVSRLFFMSFPLLTACDKMHGNVIVRVARVCQVCRTEDLFLFFASVLILSLSFVASSAWTNQQVPLNRVFLFIISIAFSTLFCM